MGFFARYSPGSGELAAQEADLGGRLEEEEAAMQEALAKSLRAPSPADQLSWVDQDHEGSRGSLRAKVAGFSLHAGQSVWAEDREGLERLCRYRLRAPFSQERLSLREDGRVVDELRRPWPNSPGVTHLVLEPRELLRRLAALVPTPGTQMIRYHGVFANRSKHRSQLPPPPPRLLPEGVEPPAKTPESPEPPGGPKDGASRGRRRHSWAQLLHRVLFLDALLCAKCGRRMKVLAFLSDPSVVKRILEHLGLPSTTSPLAPALPLDPRPLWREEDPDPLNVALVERSCGQEGTRAPP